ncbi:hypothetical protein BDV93DRAFT_526646 [Ceratobasidium sp. AG-I]|nr:hypothetical protein BDV93DRAFT_526646 [Ceratobasidium sp. AG-I]
MYKDDFRQWKNLHNQLLSLIQDYITACSTLEKAFSCPPRSTSDRTDLEDLLILVDEELLDVSTNGTPLREAFTCLTRLRNRSTKLVPISVLPPEILSSIFLTVRNTDASCLSGLHNNEPRPAASFDAIMGVSSSWRLTAIRTPQLWSHIDLVATGYWKNRTFARARLWLERVSNAPLVMHIQDVSKTVGAHPTDTDVSDTASLVAAHLGQLRNLTVNMYVSDRRLARSILHHILADSRSTSILAAIRINVSKGAQSSDPFNIFPTSPSPNQLQVLTSLRLLKLASVHIDWASGLYSCLTELDLRDLPEHTWPTTKQMATVLSSSPRLCRLRLSDLGIVTGESYNPPAPIILDELRDLNLLKLSAGLVHFLTLISACPKLSSASISLGDSIGEGRAIRSFFHQSPIVTLYVQDLRITQGTQLAPLVGSLLHLKSLVLGEASVNFELLARDMNFWPRLEMMYLLKCEIASNYVPPASSSNLRSLVMWDCGPEFGDESDEDMLDGEDAGDRDAQVMVQLTYELRTFVPKVKLLRKGQKNPVAAWFVSR